MFNPGETDLILFVAGEPSPGTDSMRDVDTSVWGRFVGMLVGGRLLVIAHRAQLAAEGSHPATEDEPPWHLPPQQIQCADLVLQGANLRGKSVTLVDVNRSAGFEDLVERWVGPNDVVPLLVRSDGARLEGVEDFVPRKVRRFIDGR